MLPDLESSADTEIVSENIRAVQAIYAAFLLEEARVFQVVDRIAELSGQGLLPLGRGRAAEELARFARSGDRLSERERAGFYSRALGTPGGANAGEPNREFLSLWMRLVASVAMYVRQREVPESLPPRTVTAAHVRRAARALAANASAHGGGLVSTAAQRLAADVRRLFEILGDPELQQAFGARDVWQVVEQISARELGGARNTARYRRLSEAGSRILGWLADHAGELGSASSGQSAGAADAADADLVDAVEQWLAASGIPDDAVEELSQPTESPTLVSSPVDLRSLVRDLLGAIGIEGLEGLGPGGGESPAPKLGSLVAWFQGAPRTGKTLAAHLLAAALARDVMRIDLAAVVSKYIGETEKNLAALLDAAEQAGAVLLIDDADALFGRRGEVKDAQDRFANLDSERLIGQLSERIVAYKGLVIVATNRAESAEQERLVKWWRQPRVVRFPRGRG